MGNNQDKQNAQFGKNFNFEQHNRKMAQISNNYSNHNYTIQKKGHPNAPKDQSYKQLSRKNAIFKPSINISITNEIKISFEYTSLQGCSLQIYLGVNNINEDAQKKYTTQIHADYRFIQNLAPGTKVKFQKTYPNYDKKLSNKQIILRLQHDQQATQISLRKANQVHQNWKIILQKLQIGQKSYQLENIYAGGSQGQQCIICMTQKSNTIVKPCNHLCLCKQCAALMSNKTNKCPICRKNINQLVTLNSS